MSNYGEPPPDIVARLRPICAGLPETREEHAWVGIRWRIRTRTFAHVLDIERGPPAELVRVPGEPVTVVTFRSDGPELDILTRAGPPFYQPGWHPSVVGMALTGDTDWDEVGELLTESYRIMAPRKLAARLDG